MKRLGNVAIVGVGLIGGSIGLALRQRNLVENVIGIGRRQVSLRIARRVGAITHTTIDMSKGSPRPTGDRLHARGPHRGARQRRPCIVPRER